MDRISKKTGVLMITVFMLILSAMVVTAQPALPESYVGKVYIGNLTAPASTAVRATTTHYNGSSVTYNTTVSGSGGDYSLDIPVGNSDAPNGAASGASITWYVGSTAATACGTATPPTGSCTDVVTAGATNTWNLVIPASCTDSIKNQDELLVDCGGSCGSCLSVTSGITMSADVSDSAQNGTGTLTVSSGSASSYTPNIPVTLAATNLINTANVSDTISMSLSSSALLLKSGSSNSSTVTVTIPGNKSAGTYTGNISVRNTMNLSNSTVTVTLTVSEVGGVARAKHYMVLTATPPTGVEFCVNQPVTIYVNDTNTGRELSGVDIDAIYNGVKVFYNLATDRDGKVVFTPNKVGIWNVTASVHNYRDTEIKINVKSCVATTTTVKPVVTTTTVKPVVTTTTVKPVVTTTTVKPVVTTTVPTAPVTTTITPVTPAPAVPSWLVWLVLIIIIIVILYLVLAKKGKGGESGVK